MLSRWLEKRFTKALEEALRCPIERVDGLEAELRDMLGEWGITKEALDATYNKVHRELGHITKRQGLDKSDEPITEAERVAGLQLTPRRRGFR